MVIKQNFKIFSGTAHKDLAEKIAGKMGKDLGKVEIKKFSCGETYVKLLESVRGHEVFIISTITENVNEDYIELFLLCDAARRSFAIRTHVILPYFGYARQDKIHEARETISAKLFADLLVTSGASHVITLDLHSDQIQGFFDIPVDNLSAKMLFIKHLKTKELKNAVVVSPDAGGVKNAKKFANALGFSLAMLHKTRKAHNMSEVIDIVGEIKGKTVILIDDLVDTAGSVANAAEALRKAGAAKDMYLAVTHPVLSGAAAKNLKRARFKEILLTDSIPIKKEKLLPEIKIVSISHLIAHVMENVLKSKPVSTLF